MKVEVRRRLERRLERNILAESRYDALYARCDSIVAVSQHSYLREELYYRKRQLHALEEFVMDTAMV